MRCSFGDIESIFAAGDWHEVSNRTHKMAKRQRIVMPQILKKKKDAVQEASFRLGWSGHIAVS